MFYVEPGRAAGRGSTPPSWVWNVKLGLTLVCLYRKSKISRHFSTEETKAALQ